MKLKTPAVSGKIIKRYKRFLCDVRLDDGQLITAHCPNPGRMTSCIEAGWPARLTAHNDPKRKLQYTLDLVHNGVCWIAVNTHLANAIVLEALKKEQINLGQTYTRFTPEQPYGEKSRIDILAETENKTETETKKCYIEIKSVTLKHNELAMFPDAPTTRGQKHLKDLMQCVDNGHRAILLFLIQRSDVEMFVPAEHVDPIYSQLLDMAINKGVDCLAYHTTITEKCIHISGICPISIKNRQAITLVG